MFCRERADPSGEPGVDIVKNALDELSHSVLGEKGILVWEPLKAHFVRTFAADPIDVIVGDWIGNPLLGLRSSACHSEDEPLERHALRRGQLGVFDAAGAVDDPIDHRRGIILDSAEGVLVFRAGRRTLVAECRVEVVLHERSPRSLPEDRFRVLAPHPQAPIVVAEPLEEQLGDDVLPDGEGGTGLPCISTLGLAVLIRSGGAGDGHLLSMPTGAPRPKRIRIPCLNSAGLQARAICGAAAIAGQALVCCVRSGRYAGLQQSRSARHKMTKTEIRLFVGEPIADPAELNLINRLRLDLSRRGVRGTLYANFFPEVRKSLQVDLLVRTENRTAHVEIKGFNPRYPVRGRKNGPWTQLLPDGQVRPLGRNCGHQARNGTYAISDAMGSLADSGAAAAANGPFYLHIDTVVGMWEAVPEGSDIDPPPHVTVVGYSGLLDRLMDPGPAVPWSDDEWDAFARHHGLFQLEADSPAELRRRDCKAIIDDCRFRAKDVLADGLRPLVDLGATGPDDMEADAGAIDRWLADGRAAVIVGPSGSGKTFLARHLAVRHCDAGRLVLWARASDYAIGEFGGLIARAMAPFSVERWNDLIAAAEEVGVPITIFIDGLNECPAQERSELLRQVQAFTMHHPAGVLVTTTTDEGLGGTLQATIFRPREPDEDARAAILASCGARRPELISPQLRTPHELAIAAQCETELADNASAADLHDAFIRNHAPTETIRAGLRALAGHLHTELRTSAPLIEAVQVLNSPQTGLSAEQIDAVIGTALLEVDRHRVRFRHDLFGQHLAAESLVLAAESGQALGALLSPPASRVLIQAALRIERDGLRTWEALRELADPTLIASATRGEYGTGAAQRAADSIRTVLRAGVSATNANNASFEWGDSAIFKGVEEGDWATARQWSDFDRVLLAAAGASIAEGMFFDEACELIDRTDELCQAQVPRLQSEGVADPLTGVIRSTYSQVAGQIGGCLAASLLIRALRKAARFQPGSSISSHRGLARRFAEGAGPQSWGRYCLAVLTVDPSDPDDQAFAASLLQRAWDTGALDVQLEAIDMIRHMRWHAAIAESHRAEIGEVLRSLEPGRYLAMHDRLGEELSAFGLIENPADPDELRDEISAAIADYIDIETARRIVSLQYENQDIVGPYWDAIESLPAREKAQLLITAASGDTSSTLWINQTIGQLVALVPTGDPGLDEAAKTVFAAHLTSPHEDAFMEHEAIGAYLYAIAGWAEFEPSLLPHSNDPASPHRSWCLVAGLQLRYERDDAQVDAEGIWDALLADPGRTAATLTLIDHSDYKETFDEDRNLVRRRNLPERLADDYPEPMRRLCEWALENADQIASVEHTRDRTLGFAIRTLGGIGNEHSTKALHPYTLDPKIGNAAVEAIQQINNRVAP